MKISFNFSLRYLQLHLSLYLYLTGSGNSFMFQLAQVRRLPCKVQVFLYVFVRLLLLWLVFFISRSAFLLLMDELSKIFAPFPIPTTEGMNGGFVPSPVPTPPTENYGVGLIHDTAGSSQQTHDEGQPGSSHLAPHQGQQGGEAPEKNAPPQMGANDADFRGLLHAHERISEIIREIHQELGTRVPGGFQAERLTEILEERHGGERMNEILRSLQTERPQSTYFQEVQTDFRNLRDSGGTEQQLRKD